MEDNIYEIYQAADVILLIINNEGELEDSIEYPGLFNSAYDLLLPLNIIKRGDGKYSAGDNFEKAYKSGIRVFIEKQNKPSKVEKLLNNKFTMMAIAGAVLGLAGWLGTKMRK